MRLWAWNREIGCYFARSPGQARIWGVTMFNLRGLMVLPLVLAGCLETEDPAPDVVTPTSPQVDVQPIPDEEDRYTLKVTGLNGQSFPQIHPLWVSAIEEVCGNTLINPYSLNEVLERDVLGRAIPTLQGTVSCR